MANGEPVMSSSVRSGRSRAKPARQSARDRETARAAGPVVQTPRNQIQENPSAASSSKSASGTSSSVARRRRSRPRSARRCGCSPGTGGDGRRAQIRYSWRKLANRSPLPLGEVGPRRLAPDRLRRSRSASSLLSAMSALRVRFTVLVLRLRGIRASPNRAPVKSRGPARRVGASSPAVGTRWRVSLRCSAHPSWRHRGFAGASPAETRAALREPLPSRQLGPRCEHGRVDPYPWERAKSPTGRD